MNKDNLSPVYEKKRGTFNDSFLTHSNMSAGAAMAEKSPPIKAHRGKFNDTNSKHTNSTVRIQLYSYPFLKRSRKEEESLFSIYPNINQGKALKRNKTEYSERIPKV